MSGRESEEDWNEEELAYELSKLSEDDIVRINQQRLEEKERRRRDYERIFNKRRELSKKKEEMQKEKREKELRRLPEEKQVRERLSDLPNTLRVNIEASLYPNSDKEYIQTLYQRSDKSLLNQYLSMINKPISTPFSELFPYVQPEPIYRRELNEMPSVISVITQAYAQPNDRDLEFLYTAYTEYPRLWRQFLRELDEDMNMDFFVYLEKYHPTVYEQL